MIVVPNIQTPNSLADWIETSLLIGTDARLSDTSILDVMGEADLPDLDNLLADATKVIRLRRNILNNRYPIVRGGQGFTRENNWPDSLPYSFMLFVSLNQVYPELRFGQGTANEPAELFENITANSIQNYLRCNVIRIGAPRRKPVPSKFPTAIDYLCNTIGELAHQRDLEDHNSGDDGVDLVGWQSFQDNRHSQAIIFAQCAIGENWREKRDEVSLELWRRHVDWHSSPLKGFAVPFHHDPGRAWRETATRSGIIFDRIRITKLVQPDQFDGGLTRKIETFCKKRIKQIDKLTIPEL